MKGVGSSGVGAGRGWPRWHFPLAREDEKGRKEGLVLWPATTPAAGVGTGDARDRGSR